MSINGHFSPPEDLQQSPWEPGAPARRHTAACERGAQKRTACDGWRHTAFGKGMLHNAKHIKTRQGCHKQTFTGQLDGFLPSRKDVTTRVYNIRVYMTDGTRSFPRRGRQSLKLAVELRIC